MLSPSRLVERERHAGVVERFADEVAALWGDVGVLFAEDLGRENEYVSMDCVVLLGGSLYCWNRFDTP